MERLQQQHEVTVIEGEITITEEETTATQDEITVISLSIRTPKLLTMLS